jgi:tetratricopeptide (TPR) repeat protein
VHLKRYDDAIDCCDKAIELDSKYFAAWSTKGGALHQLGHFEKALECLDKAIELNAEFEQSWYVRGLLLCESKRLEDAITCFERVIQLAPENVSAWCEKGKALARLQRFEEALECFERVVELEPDNPSQWYMCGFVLNNRNSPAKAIKCFEEAIERKPDFSRAWCGKGDALRQLGRFKEGLSCFVKATELDPNDFNSWLGRSIVLHELERSEEAIDCLDKAIELEPDNSHTWRMKGLFLCDVYRYTDAIECFEKTVHLDPENHEAWADCGAHLLRLDRAEEALTCYTKAAELVVDSPKYWLGQAAAFVALDRLDEALECSRKAVELQPENCELWLTKASLLLMLKRHLAALDCLNEATILHPKDPTLWYWKGITLWWLQKNSEALGCFGRAAKLQPEDYRIWHAWGKLLYSMGKYPEALECLDQAVKLEPNIFLSWLIRGEVLANMKKSDEAVASFEKAVELKPDNFLPLLCRGMLLEERDDFQEALEHLDRWLTRMPDNPYVWLHRGIALFHLGRAEESLVCFDKVLDLDFIIPGFWCYRGMAQGMLRRHDEALESFSKGCHLSPDNYQPWFLSGTGYLLAMDYRSAMSDFKRASRAASKKAMREERELCEGAFYWASAMDCYMENNYDKAKTHLSKALECFARSDSEPLGRLMEFLIQNIELDDDIRTLAYPNSIESLRTDVKQLYRRARNLCEAHGIRFTEKLSRDPFLAKSLILKLFLQALDENVVDENLINQIRETLERFPSSEWITILDDITALLREIIVCKTISRNEERILRLARKLELAHREVTGEGLKAASRDLNLLRRDSFQAELRDSLGRIDASVGRLLETKEAKGPGQIKITFKTASVTVEGMSKPLQRWNVLRLAAYVILRKKENVHWLWAYIILPRFEPHSERAEWQFRNYMSTAKGILKEYGIHIATYTEGVDGFASFQNIDKNVDSNINDVMRVYELAQSEYASNVSQGIKTLSKITEDRANNWYIFTAVYMKLAEWIREENFEGISNDLIDNCTSFLRWYCRKLEIGLERIDGYCKKSPLSKRAREELKDIQRELRDANSLRAALIKKRKLPEEEQAYEKLTKDLRLFQKWYWMLVEESMEKDVYDRKEMTVRKKAEINNDYMLAKMIVSGVERLCERCTTVHDIIVKGFDVLDNLLDQPRGRRSKYTSVEIKGMREGVYWKLGEVIGEIKSFDMFDQTTGGKYVALETYLCSHLRKKLERDSNDIINRA